MQPTYPIATLLFALITTTFAAPLHLPPENANKLNNRIDDELEIPRISAPSGAESEPRLHPTVKEEDERPSSIDKRLPKFGLWASPKEEAMSADKKAHPPAALAARGPGEGDTMVVNGQDIPGRCEEEES
ncbi:hypothetical protein EMCG_05202 [[Emmonsia] crescens]|uniref:Uncharacterized protein n=1 Tax=[Emmonsia] crescens TaxID=73230 RepID=A0A0G2HQS6_9EURO|nr:hypothetical protein EMCG_05202 [Emmonsia crescens UAMH 3008]